MSLSRELDAAQPGIWTVGKMAIDGSGLFQHWKVGSGVPSTPAEYADQFITFAQTWAAEQDAAIGAICWIQGEQDAAIDAGFGAQYETLLTALVAHWRAALGANVPVIVIKLHTSSSGLNTSVIRAQQVSFAASVANVALIDVDDLVLTDGLHFDADSLVEIGVRVVAALMGMA